MVLVTGIKVILWANTERQRFIIPIPTGIIPGGMILTGIPNQGLCDFQIVGKNHTYKGLSFF